MVWYRIIVETSGLRRYLLQRQLLLDKVRGQVDDFFAETAVTHVQWITEMEERMTSMRVASLDQVHLLAGFPSEQTNQLLIESLQKKSMESPNGSLQDLLCLYDEVETKMKSIHQELTQRQGMTEQLCCLASDLSALVNSSWAETRASEVKSRLVAATDLACSHLVRIHEDRQKAKTFQNAAQDHLVWCLDAEQALKALDLSGDEGSFQNVSKQLTDWMQKLESQHFILAESESMAEDILHVCPPGGAAIILRWARIIRGRFDEVQACANGIQTRIAANRFALEKDTRRAEELMSWLARMQDMMAEEEIEPEKAEVTKECLARHQALVTEMTALQPEVDRLVRLYRRRGLSDPLSPISSSSTLSPSTPSTQPDFRSGTSPGSQVSNQSSPPVPMGCSSPQLQPLLTLWQRVWLAVLDRQGRLRETQNNPQEKKEDKKDNEDFFTTWGWRCLQWAGHRRLRVLDYFCRLDKDQDGLIHRQDFIQALLDSKTGINDEEATTIARMFEKGGGLVDYYELVEALTSAPTRGQPQTDADKIDDEVTRKVAACRCPKRFQVEQIEENKYRFGESQQLRLVRILRSAVMVRVGGGWSSLDEFLLKNDPCRASVDGCSTMDMRNRLSVPDGKGLTAAAFQPKPRRSPLGRSPSAPSLPQQISGAPAIINPKGKVSRASSQRSVKSRTPVAKTSQSSASSPSNRSAGCGSKKLSRSRSLGKPEDLMAWETVASRVYSQTDIAHQSESRQVHTGAHQPNGKSSRIPTAMPTSALSRKTSNRWR